LGYIVRPKKFTFERGNKNEHGEDWVIKFGPSTEKITFKDIAKQIIFMMDNEDRIYPKEKDFEGRDKFKRYIQEVLDTGKIPSDKKHQLV